MTKGYIACKENNRSQKGLHEDGAEQRNRVQLSGSVVTRLGGGIRIRILFLVSRPPSREPGPPCDRPEIK